jgi:hypothetical protein
MEPINWRAMTPEQRNEIIHQKVMGVKLLCTGRLVKSTRDELMRRSAYICMECLAVLAVTDDYLLNRALPKQHRKHIPPYTTSLDVAWKLVEHLRGQKYCVAFHLGYDARKVYEGMFSFRNVGADQVRVPYKLSIQTSETSPAEAICIAALRACGYEVLTEGVK